MDIGSINHEVDFFRAQDLDTRDKVEKVLLQNRISYFIEWEDRRIGGLFRKPGSRTSCMFRIHSDEVPRARELLTTALGKNMKDSEGEA